MTDSTIPSDEELREKMGDLLDKTKGDLESEEKYAELGKKIVEKDKLEKEKEEEIKKVREAFEKKDSELAAKHKLGDLDAGAQRLKMRGM